MPSRSGIQAQNGLPMGETVEALACRELTNMSSGQQRPPNQPGQLCGIAVVGRNGRMNHFSLADAGPVNRIPSHTHRKKFAGEWLGGALGRSCLAPVTRVFHAGAR